jgi:hypothetical protein
LAVVLAWASASETFSWSCRDCVGIEERRRPLLIDLMMLKTVDRRMMIFGWELVGEETQGDMRGASDKRLASSSGIRPLIAWRETGPLAWELFVAW